MKSRMERKRRHEIYSSLLNAKRYNVTFHMWNIGRSLVIHCSLKIAKDCASVTVPSSLRCATASGLERPIGESLSSGI
jgi:hypothetical protein